VHGDPVEVARQERFQVELDFLLHPVFWTVVLILAAAWKAGSVMERWHQENISARQAKHDSRQSSG
jgi:hypothetical protein